MATNNDDSTNETTIGPGARAGSMRVRVSQDDALEIYTWLALNRDDLPADPSTHDTYKRWGVEYVRAVVRWLDDADVVEADADGLVERVHHNAPLTPTAPVEG